MEQQFCLAWFQIYQCMLFVRHKFTNVYYYFASFTLNGILIRTWRTTKAITFYSICGYNIVVVPILYMYVSMYCYCTYIYLTLWMCKRNARSWQRVGYISCLLPYLTCKYHDGYLLVISLCKRELMKEIMINIFSTDRFIWAKIYT